MDYQIETDAAHPSSQPWSARLKKALAPIGVMFVLIAKFFAKLKFIILPALKFLPILLKSGGTMILSIWVYALVFGWQFAVGFVLLLFVHECGHLIVAKKFGLPVSAPVFIPFMGAFILLKDQPRNAWMEACVGIGGPMLGAVGALACNSLGEIQNSPTLLALASSGYFLNLFNLMPVGFLDGGRIVTALSRWLWLPGFALLLWFGWTYPNLIVWLIIITALPRVFSLFRKRSQEEQRYFEVKPARRWIMSILYFGLITVLALGWHTVHNELADRGFVERVHPRHAIPQ
jgi:Zn-dependent protease